METINEDFYQSKKNFFKKRSKTVTKVFSHGPQKEPYLRHLNLDFNPENYKYKELVPTVITDKFYLMEEEYKSKGIPFSPFLLQVPDSLIKKQLGKLKEEDFNYYKRHILLENYDEEPEEQGQINLILTKYKEKNGKVSGYTKWFDSQGNQAWKQCEILSYDETDRLFSITIRIENNAKFLPSDSQKVSIINKKVTRFNCLIEDEEESNLVRRVNLAEKWKFYAQKYMAFYHFVTESLIKDPYDMIDEKYMDRLLTLSFLYRGINKQQCTPIDIENMDNSERFGIWRKYVFQRKIDVNKKKIQAKTKTYPKPSIDRLKTELKEINERSFHLHEFYKTLPMNYCYYKLLNDIIPLNKFLTSSERFLLPEKYSGQLTFNRKHEYLDMYTKMQYKLHQNEHDLMSVLTTQKKYIEDEKRKMLFYTNFNTKPINLDDFKAKNTETMNEFFKEIQLLTNSYKNGIKDNLERRKKEAEKVNKDIGVPPHILHKFRKYQNLVNRVVATYTRNNYHKSMAYIISMFGNVNKTVSEYHSDLDFIGYINQKRKEVKEIEEQRQKEREERLKEEVESQDNNEDKNRDKDKDKDQDKEKEKKEEEIIAPITLEPKISFKDLIEIRDDFHLEELFTTNFSLWQFSFDLKCESKTFSFEPDYKTFVSSIENHIKSALSQYKQMVSISEYDLATKEELIDYYSQSTPYLTVFFEDDNSYLEELENVKKAFEEYFAPGEIMLNYLNKNIMPSLLSLLKFSNSKNLDEESVNIKDFREYININKDLFEFFTEMFKYDQFFLGGLLINVKNVRDVWLKRLSDSKDKLFKLVMTKNVFLSDRMEKERKEIEKRLEEEPETVDDYALMVKYCKDLEIKMKGIWEKINSQQENAELLEENFNVIEKGDFVKMWSCYGIPRALHVKKEETQARLEADRKVFKKKVRQRYLDTILEISKLKQDFETNTIINEINTYEESFKFFSSHKYEIDEMIKSCHKLNDHEAILRMKTSDLSEIKEIKQNFDPYFDLWDSVFNFENGKKSWLEDTLKTIDRKRLKITYEKCINTIDNLEKTVFRKDKPYPHQIIQLLREKIREFEPILPVLYDLINPDFKANHINDLSKAIGIVIPDNLDISMNELISRGILTKNEEINDRSAYATGQKKLNATLDKMKEKYKQMKFETANFKNTDVVILKDVDPLTEEIDAVLTKIVSMSNSKYAKYLQKDIHYIWNNISKAQEIIDAWLKAQKLLTQLQQIFVYGDLKKQLSEEYPKYQRVEKEWKQVMEQVKGSPQLSEVIQLTKIKESFFKWTSILEDVNKSLNAYLNMKRDVFPRFYFVSNEELTLMLAQSGDPGLIATVFIQQVFDGMKRLNYTSETKKFDFQDEETGETMLKDFVIKKFNEFISEQGEVVSFNQVINPTEEIQTKDGMIIKTILLEQWLGDVEHNMQITLKKLFKDCFFDLINENTKRELWASNHIEQAVLTISQLDWTSRTTKAIFDMSQNGDSLKELYEHDKNQLLALIKTIRTQDSLSKLFKKTLVSLIIQDVHANDTIDYLIQNNVSSVTAFEWISQLRYYFVNQKYKDIESFNEIYSINVRMLNTERTYDFEYLGNQKRLVITPLTDRCYRTMMEALSNCLGGAPEGPAGTGKTETIKDLSKNLGKKCFTYNCSEDSDYNLMTKFFKGIAMGGSWVCFDEFNRISLDVLSVIAHLISVLLTSLRGKTTTCTLDGAKFNFNFNMGIFITMNPDYAGRSELPDNLKGLFRPLAMMIPNYEMITEIMLYSFGFNNARALSKKIVSSLKLASEQLSSQFHYDYGMRALNGIINYIGVISTENRIETQQEEEFIVQKAIRDSNMPKFIADDYKIYEGILSDLFPIGEFKNKNDEILLQSIKSKASELNLISNDFLVSKVIDFINIMSVRHAVMIVGAPMSNKSSIFKVYLNALPNYYQQMNMQKSVKATIINPKSITGSQLFGFVNKKTMEFSEGVCSKTLRDYFADQSEDTKLLCFDGPVDTMWIENMNSVLDDTKKLCLENSDQIRLDERTFIIFEIDDLSQASLATISRCGMVYTDRVNIDPNDFFASWLKTFPRNYYETNFFELIQNLFECYYSKIVNDYLFDEYNNLRLKMSIPFFKNWFMKIFIEVLESLLFDEMSKEDAIENELEKKRMKESGETDNTITIVKDTGNKSKDNMKRNLNKKEKKELFNKFFYSLVISFCWVVDNPKEQRAVFEKILDINKNLVDSQDIILKEELLNFCSDYSDIGTNFLNYLFNQTDNQFTKIADMIQDNKEESFKKIRENMMKNQTVMIPSIQSYKANSLLELAQYSRKPLLFYGSTATGKSLLIQNYINSNAEKFSETNWLCYTFILNSKTSANNICDLIEEKISFKLKKGTVAPPGNKNGLILVEDLNMPVKERYGAQPPIEILRQYFDYGGWYDRKEKDFLYLKNILLCSCLTTGRPIVSMRLLWHFIPFNFQDINDVSLREIFNEYYEAKFFEYPNNIRKYRESIVDTVIHCYKDIQSLFRPLPITPQYNFNLRDLIKIFQGIGMIKQDSFNSAKDLTDYVGSVLIHESCRVFYDRLCNDSDREKFANEVLFPMQQKFQNNSLNIIDTLFFSEMNTNYAYERVENIEELRTSIYSHMNHYNMSKKSKDKLELILFEYSFKHLLRIDRILSRNSEHAVLIGLTGSGRQSLVSLAAYIKKFKIFKVRSKEEVDEYGHKEWLKDIQELYIQAGVRQENTIFMLKDNNISDEQMYVDLNCIISSGVVYNLFSSDEKMETLGNLKQIKEYDDLNCPDDQSLWEAFIAKTLQKCRVFLAMNPLNPNFSKILRSFPALLNTTIDWYEQWPENALFYLAKRDLSKDINEDTSEDLAFIFSKVFTQLNELNVGYFQQTRKKVIILPKSFLDLLSLYKHLNKKHSEKIDLNISKYKEGVKKIDEAGEQIRIMTELLEQKKPLLLKQGEIIAKTLGEISVQSTEAEAYKEQCQENEKIAMAKQSEAEYKKAVADESKMEAELIREDINKKIMMIDKKQFMAVRSYRVPPTEITKMMAAIVIIMSNFEKKPLDVVPTQWDYYKKRLNDVKLLKTLETLPKKLETNLLQEKIVKLLQPYIVDPDLEPSYMEKKISSTCACFCHFIMSMYKLDDLLKTKLIPLSLASEEATNSFTLAQENLNKIRKNFAETQDKLDKLKESYNKINLEQEQLQAQIQESQKKLNRAQKLTSKLSGEQKRWAENAVQLEEKKLFVFGDVILSSIFISFMGPFLGFFRDNFIKDVVFKYIEEKNIKFSKIGSINKIIGDPFKISDWIINGLPPDSGSVDNGVILFESTKPCLLVDPQKQALKFLSKLYKNEFLLYKKAEHEKIRRIDENHESMIEISIKNGKVLVFDYISFDLPSDAELLLESEEILIKGEKYIKLSESSEVPLHPKFKYFLISYLANPIFNPELYAKISIINFTINEPGLIEQLLSVIVKEESPADETEKSNILQKKFQLNETIHKTEEDILSKLNVSSETLLDNDGLIFSLEESKKLSDEATIQISNARITEERIDKSRMLYIQLSKLATLIFFVINELSNLETIYQFSISWYIKEILINSIRQNEFDKTNVNTKSVDFVKNRVNTLSQSLLKTSYSAVCRSLLNKDKIVFSLMILIRKLNEEEKISKQDIELFLSDFNNVKGMTKEEEVSRPDFITEGLWKKIVVMNKNEIFKGIITHILDNKGQWDQYINTTLKTRQFDSHLQFPLNDQMESIHKMIALKIFNPEGLGQYLKIVISQYLGNELGQIPLFTIEELFEMSTHTTPLLLIITPGLDPSNDVRKIGEDNGKEIVLLSLGQGQSKKALDSIELCEKKGEWVFLQNLHLVPNFMKSLEQVISSLQNNEHDVNPLFRLWISALPSNNILSSVLVNSLKITIESPSGVKSNLTKLIKTQEKSWQYEHETMKRIAKEYEFTKLFLCLMHFHSILLERKNFGPIGWNIKYNFNESDFQIAKNILKSNLEKYSNPNDKIPFTAIIYLTADCIYGGRVTDDWDRRALYAILHDLYSEEMLNEEEYHINNLSDYSIPFFETYEAYYQKIIDLPDNESPEVLGLHKNTLIRKQIDESNLIVASFGQLTKGSESQGLTNKLKLLQDIQKTVSEQLIREFNIDEIKKKYPLIYEDCMNSILIQEIMRYNNLLSLIFRSLEDCVKAFLGHLPLTDEIEEMSNEIVLGSTPSNWIRASYPSKKPIHSWINDLKARIQFFNEWIDNGTPIKFWLSAFFFTQSFLTGIKQNYARKHKESIDRLEFDFGFVDNENYDMDKVNRREEYYIYGVFIEGAQWNNNTHTIDELKDKNVSCQMPPIILRVKLFSDIVIHNGKDGKYTYESPVYKCSSRQGTLSTTGHSTNYIFTINLPSLVHSNHWVKRGVALLNQLDD